ncbi:biotin--[acetyl-CoA-carboxylase] ligase [Haloarchaeobius litoreus]|uniref:Biotin--[acetyl-CoA-carboxylase] ligase n=1 Tax=Haloarchaeobius litoreus TaxID=755306 RepID=A0ABD6DHF8_9EURY|nr:biotin--[acetyl-CoA-carboxylase] ligase [Haloarchaeobius litoreus]
MNETRRRVLAALADGPVSGPALADTLGVSRAAVWKHVEAIREAGFGVESGDDGYRLTAVPEYGGLAIAHGLAAPYEIEYHDALGSTNDRARELADEGAGDVVVVADEQTGGRGRLDREWAAPPGGVYASILTRPHVPPSQVPLATLAAAVAVTRAAREAGVDARIKWPNDVLVAVDDGEQGERVYRKLAGILTEMEGEADRVSWLVVGIGVNANVATADLPPTGTSLREQLGENVDRRVFLQRVLEEYHELGTDVDAVLPAWRDHALTLGQRVRVETPSGEVVGEAVDVESPGALLVETDDGVVRVSAGDCEHLRPVDAA